jgi:hypothetical protein
MRTRGALAARVLLSTALVGLALVVPATPVDATTPGTPGVTQPGTTVFTEDFENGITNTATGAQSYATPGASYVGASGQTYTGSPKWTDGARCNGIILSYSNSTTPTWALSGSSAADSGANGRCSDASGVRSYQFLRMLALAMGQQFTPGSPTTDHVTSSYTECQNSNTGDSTCDTLPTGSAVATGSVLFKTNQPITTIPGHYYAFGVDTAYMNCGAASADPLYQFATVNPVSGAVTSFGSTLNGCQTTSDPTVTSSTQSVTSNVGGAFGTVTRTVRINSMLTNSAFQATGTSIGLEMYNANGTTNGNDGAFDNVRLIDVTPQLDKSFSPALIAPGGTSTVTLTVTNTSNLTLADLTVLDAMLPVVTCDLLVLDPGASTTCVAHAPHVITQADVDAGEVDNTAIAVGTPPDGGTTTSNRSSTRTPTDQVSKLALTKRVASVVDVDGNGMTGVGDRLVYSFALRNLGTTTLASAVVHDPKLEALGITLSCPAGGLAPGQEIICTADQPYVVTAADVRAGHVVNTATAAATPPGGSPPVDAPPSSVTWPLDKVPPPLPPTPGPNGGPVHPGVLPETGAPPHLLGLSGAALVLLLAGAVVAWTSRGAKQSRYAGRHTGGSSRTTT